MDKVEYNFYGFNSDQHNQNDPFISYFNFRYQQIMNLSSDIIEVYHEVDGLEKYSKFFSEYKEKKEIILASLNEVKEIKIKPSIKESDNIKQEQKQGEEDSIYQTYESFEEFEEYTNYENKQIKIDQQIQKENALRKNEAVKQAKNLQEITLEKAWKLLYENPLSQSVKQCFINIQLYQYYLDWFYLVLSEVMKSNEINECTINMSNLNLDSTILQSIYKHVDVVINQCDNIIVYKLNLQNNQITSLKYFTLLCPRNITHLTLELQNNLLDDSAFNQFYILDNIQILTLHLEGNPLLTSSSLAKLAFFTHPNLEVELFISQNLNQNDAIIEFVGKCHSLTINDKQLIQNNSFELDLKLDDINEKQFLKLIQSIINNINFDSSSSQQPTSMHDKLFSFSSRQNFGSKYINQKSYQQINLLEDNKDRRNQQGSQLLITNQNSLSKSKSSVDLDSNKKEQTSFEILEKEKPHSSEEQKEDDEDDDVEITEKKDLILKINGTYILNTQEDSQLTLNLSIFDMSIFQDRNVYKMIGKLPKIPTNLQVKNYLEMEDKDKQLAKLILSRNESQISINEKTYNMKSFIINLSDFCEVEQELIFLMQNLQQNNSIENLEVQLSSSDNASILGNLIVYFDSLEVIKLKELRIVTDIEQSSFLFPNPKRKYRLSIVSQQPKYRKLSENVVRVDQMQKHSEEQTAQFYLK